MRRLSQLLWRALRGLLLALAAIILFIEEWGWRPLTAWMARLAHWPPIAALETRLRRTSPRVALVLFLVPALLLFPVKLLALWLIHLGSAGLGVAVILAAKLLGTALVGRLFMLTEPQLMQFAWFVRALHWWRETKARVHAALLRSAVWRTMQRSRRIAALWLRRHTRNAR